MICEVCGFDNSPAAKACGKCGSPLKNASTTESYAFPPLYQPPPGKTSTINTPPAPPPQPQSSHSQQPSYQDMRHNPQEASDQRSPLQPSHQPNTKNSHISTSTFPTPNSSFKIPNSPPSSPPTPHSSFLTPNSQGFPLKKVALIGASTLVIIIIAVFVISMLLGTENDTALSNSIEFFRDIDSVVVSIDNNEKFSISGEALSWQISLGADKAVALMDYDPVTGGELWFVTAAGHTRIADDVLDYKLADSGDGVAYLTDFDHRLDSATLYLYDTSAEKETLISTGAMYLRDNASIGYIKGLCISPDGKSVAYVSDYDSRYNTYIGKQKVDGKQEESLGDQTFAIAISNGGKQTYYMFESSEGDVSFHVKTARDDIRLSSQVRMDLPLALNASYSEAIFTELDGRTFVSRDGGVPERLTGPAFIRFILSENTPTRSHFTPYFIITINGIQTFADIPALTDEGLVYYDNTLDPIRIPNASADDFSVIDNDAFISRDGKTIIFTNYAGHLISYDPTDPNWEKTELARDVSGFAASRDGRSVYYVDKSGTLWHLKGGNASPTQITENVSPDSLVIASNSNRVFFLTNFRTSTMSGELYYSDNGGNATKIPGGDNVVELWRTPTNMFFKTYNNVLFRSNGNADFDPFHEFIND